MPLYVAWGGGAGLWLIRAADEPEARRIALEGDAAGNYGLHAYNPDDDDLTVEEVPVEGAAEIVVHRFS